MPRLLQLGSAVAAVLLIAGQAQAGTTNWMIFNDYGGNGPVGGAILNPYVTTNDVRGAQTGARGPFYFTNIWYQGTVASGAVVQAQMFITNLAGSGLQANGTIAGNPTNGPFFNTFNGWCYFRTNFAPVKRDCTNYLVFTNLNPNMRYKFAGGAVRGADNPSASYADRWSKCWIEGAASYVPAHKEAVNSPYGIITSADQGSGLADGQVAWWSGDNRWGDMIEWDDIAPGDDGTIVICCSQYYSATPVHGHGTLGTSATFTPSSTSYGYLFNEYLLVEYTACDGGFTATVRANSTSLTECQKLVLTANGNCGIAPYWYYWYKDGADMGVSDQTLVIEHVTTADAGSYSVLVFNSDYSDSRQSEGLDVSVAPDLTDPTMDSPAIATNFTSVTVNFSRPVMFSGASAFSIMKTR